VDRQVRCEGYPVRYGQRPTTRRSGRALVEPRVERNFVPIAKPTVVATRPARQSRPSSLPPGSGLPGDTGAGDGAGLSMDESAGDSVPTLFTPTQAAELLQVPESWLRRRASPPARAVHDLGQASVFLPRQP
jgi:hypothetical protein